MDYWMKKSIGLVVAVVTVAYPMEFSEVLDVSCGRHDVETERALQELRSKLGRLRLLLRLVLLLLRLVLLLLLLLLLLVLWWFLWAPVGSRGLAVASVALF